MYHRREPIYYIGGAPPQKGALPVGWAKFGLRTPPRAADLDIFNRWHVCYHGTSADKIVSILRTGDLLMPGDSLLTGGRLFSKLGHFTEKRKPAGFDINQVFVSPSIKYAGHPAYAAPKVFTNPFRGRKYKASVALQLMIMPGKYQIGPATTVPYGGRYIPPIDPGFDNQALEW